MPDSNTQSKTPQWKPIKGFTGYYEVSDTGLIRSVARTVAHGRHNARRPVASRVMKASPNKRGYLSVGLCAHGVASTRLVHILVAEAFMGERAEGTEVNHIDGVKADNAASNLEWVTSKENIRKAHEIGLIKVGQQHSRAKLTDAEVLEIRRLRKTGLTLASIAGRFSVGAGQIGFIVSGKNWSHLPL